MVEDGAKRREGRSEGASGRTRGSSLELDAGDEVDPTIEHELEIYQEAACEYRNALRKLAR